MTDIYMHKKTGGYYCVLGNVINKTDENDGITNE